MYMYVFRDRDSYFCNNYNYRVLLLYMIILCVHGAKNYKVFSILYDTVFN